MTASIPHSTPANGTDAYIVWFWLEKLKHLRRYTEHRGVVTDPDLHEDLRELGYEDAMTAFNRLVEQKETADRALRAIHFNASSWHAGEEGCRRALNVIQAWAAHPESVPEDIHEEAS